MLVKNIYKKSHLVLACTKSKKVSSFAKSATAAMQPREHDYVLGLLFAKSAAAAMQPREHDCAWFTGIFMFASYGAIGTL